LAGEVLMPCWHPGRSRSAALRNSSVVP
jgi:hypothetical protein